MKTKLFVALLLLGFSHCRKTEGLTDLGHAYFPLSVERTWVYRVDSLRYNDFDDRVDTTTSYFKVRIDSVVLDNTGEELFRTSHHWRRGPGDPWVFHHLSWLQRNEQSVQRIREDRREVMLSFPVNDFTYWDRNQYNTLDEQRVRFINMGHSIALDSVQHPNTVEVEWPEDKNPYFHTYGREIYGLDVGLLLESYTNTETQNGKTKGYHYRKELHHTAP